VLNCTELKLKEEPTGSTTTTVDLELFMSADPLSVILIHYLPPRSILDRDNYSENFQVNSMTGDDLDLTTTTVDPKYYILKKLKSIPAIFITFADGTEQYVIRILLNEYKYNTNCY